MSGVACGDGGVTSAAIAAGMVHPGRLRFVPSRVAELRRMTRRRARSCHRDAPDLTERLRAVLADRRFRTTLDLER